MTRTLVVAPYPPRPCGIGAYARTQVERLRGEGHRVTVMSPPDGHGDLRVDFFGGRPFLVAARRGGDFDRIMVHFQPALYYRPRAALSKVATSLAFLWLCLRRRQTEVLVHEADPPERWRPDYLLLAAGFRLAPVLLFHTDRERRDLERSYGVRVRARIVPHAQGITLHGPRSRTEARRRLGIAGSEPLLVCPGFLHPDKGFERAIAALREAGRGRLVIVGSVKDPGPRNDAYARRLRALADRTPGVDLVEGFVPDDEFDAWIAAADSVVLPYRRSWSSGILARAQALGTPAVVADVGGLREQVSERDRIVRDDEGLSAAVAGIVAGKRAGVGP